jgi:hypothetical protein
VPDRDRASWRRLSVETAGNRGRAARHHGSARCEPADAAVFCPPGLRRIASSSSGIPTRPAPRQSR